MFQNDLTAADRLLQTAEDAEAVIAAVVGVVGEEVVEVVVVVEVEVDVSITCPFHLLSSFKPPYFLCHVLDILLTENCPGGGG